MVCEKFGHGTNAIYDLLLECFTVPYCGFRLHVSWPQQCIALELNVRFSMFSFLAGNDAKKIECPVMNVVGDDSPHIDDSMWFNGRLNPSKSTFVKVDCLLEVGSLDSWRSALPNHLSYFSFRTIRWNLPICHITLSPTYSSRIVVEWFLKKCLKRCLNPCCCSFKDLVTVRKTIFLIHDGIE